MRHARMSAARIAGAAGAAVVSVVVVTLALGAAAAAAGVVVEGWGQLIDPDGDCRARTEPGRLVIEVPGKLHDLWPDAEGAMNAPRVLQDTPGGGDVSARVTVAGEVDARDGTNVTPEKRPFRAASLLLWQDEKNFVRLDRGCVVRAGKPIYFAYYHVFRDGKRTTHLSKDIENRPAALRLERRGNTLHAAVSQDDGKTWDAFDEQDARLAEEIKVGVAAINATIEPFTATFEGLEVVPAGD